MGCNCNKSKTKNSRSTSSAQSYKVKNPDGSSQVYTSEPDARLAAAKSGGKVVRVSR